MGDTTFKCLFAIVLSTVMIAVSACQVVLDTGYVEATKADKAGNYAKAARLFTFVANSESYDGRQAAQFRLAQMYMEGQGVERDPAKSMTLYDDVARGPDKSWSRFALHALGEYAEDGIPGFLQPDRRKAADYYNRCIATGYELCQEALRRLARHPEVYVHLHRKQFRHDHIGEAPAGMSYAFELFKKAKKEEAFPIFLWHARNGSARAQGAVAAYFRDGLAGNKDLALSRAWVWLAARNGNRNAQFKLGLLYYNGSDGIPGSDIEAEKWLEAAAKQGVVEAINSLAILKLHPFENKIKPDPDSALVYFRNAAEAGSVNAMTNLGDMYFDGIGVAVDHEIAKKYYFAAAREGNVIARRRLFESFNIVFDKKKVQKVDVAELPKPPRKATAPVPVSPVPISPSKDAKKPSPVELYTRLSPSVLRILAASVLKKERGLAQGSAVAVTLKLALTTCHVIDGMDLFGTKLGDDVAFLKFVGGDKKRDICVIRANTQLQPVVSTRSYDDLKVGEKVYAIGSPKGLQNTLSEGIISGLRKKDDIRYVQTSAPITSGSSGGGLFDEQGKLIGITTFVVKGGGNLNFAVAVDEALSVLAGVK